MNPGFHSLGRVSVKRLGLACVGLLELLALTGQLVGVTSGDVAVRPGGGGTSAINRSHGTPKSLFQ